ncbi:hypothetical protein LZ31DRAFT_303301 [Colletotrichum somersetense]|nr:hypothetical protein LZ31DRAFT_303301 [Colletotrichum somersetense]
MDTGCLGRTKIWQTPRSRFPTKLRLLPLLHIVDIAGMALIPCLITVFSKAALSLSEVAFRFCRVQTKELMSPRDPGTIHAPPCQQGLVYVEIPTCWLVLSSNFKAYTRSGSEGWWT